MNGFSVQVMRGADSAPRHVRALKEKIRPLTQGNGFVRAWKWCRTLQISTPAEAEPRRCVVQVLGPPMSLAQMGLQGEAHSLWLVSESTEGHWCAPLEPALAAECELAEVYSMRHMLLDGAEIGKDVSAWLLEHRLAALPSFTDLLHCASVLTKNPDLEKGKGAQGLMVKLQSEVAEGWVRCVAHTFASQGTCLPIHFETLPAIIRSEHASEVASRHRPEYAFLNRFSTTVSLCAKIARIHASERASILPGSIHFLDPAIVHLSGVAIDWLLSMNIRDEGLRHSVRFPGLQVFKHASAVVHLECLPPKAMGAFDSFTGALRLSSHIQSNSPPSTHPTDTDSPTDWPQSVELHLGTLELGVGDLARMQAGDVLHVPMSQFPFVDLSIHGVRIAKAELIQVNDQLAVQIIEVLDSQISSHAVPHSVEALSE